MNGVVKDRGNSGEKREEKQQPFVPPSSGAHDRHLGIRFSLSTVFHGGGITQITEAGSLKCQHLNGLSASSSIPQIPHQTEGPENHP